MKSKFFRILGVVTTVAMLAATLTIAPVLGLSQPTVSINPATAVVGVYSTYTITFTTGSALALGDKIDVTFPTGTSITGITASGADADVMVGASAGVPPSVGFALTNSVSLTTGQVLTITTPAAIGAGALVQLQIGISAANNVTNPTTAASYTLTVLTKTAAGVTIEAAQTSASYTINAYAPTTPPGLVKVFSSGGTLIWQGLYAPGDIALAITKVAAGGTIELGPGVYVETTLLTLASTACDGITIKASGALVDTIVPANWAVNSDNVTFKGITFMNDLTAGPTAGPGAGSGPLFWNVFQIGAGADNVTFDGCAFTKSGTATTTVAELFIRYGNTGTTSKGTIKNCSFDTTLGAVAGYTYPETSILVSGSNLTISKNTFKMDLDASYYSDWAIRTTYDVTISENTFTGYVNFGKGIRIENYSSEGITITKNTFTGVKVAMEVQNWAYGDFAGNTVDASGYYSATTAALNDYPLIFTATNGFGVYNNKITNSKYYIAKVVAGAADITINFNVFTGNAYGINNLDLGDTVDATHNWWGAATGPAVGHNSDWVDASNYLGGEPTNGTVVYDETKLTAKTTAGVDIIATWDGTPAWIYLMGASNYAANPAPVAPSSTLTVKKYFDVFVNDDWGNANNVVIKFYGTVLSNSEVWFYSDLAGKWVKCSRQSVNTTGGFVAVTLDYTDTVPTIADVFKTPFILVDAPLAAPVETAVVQSPTLGAINVPVDTTFTWPAVTGAVSYTFEIAEEIGQIDKFYLKDASGSSTVTAYKLLEPLKFNKQYWWRVQAVNAAGAKGTWAVSFFTTAKEPVVVEPTPPVIIKETPAPEITLEIPPSPSPVQPIPSYLLWAVIGVGAVLVIAVIVLIVRTRRIS